MLTIIEIYVENWSNKIFKILLLVAKATYKDSEEVFEIIQDIKRTEHIDFVEWSEIVGTVVKNEIEVFKTLFE